MPRGFRASALAAGIKPSGRPDLGVLATLGGPASAAAVFTTNALPAAPIRLSRAHLAASGGMTGGVLVTSGCANAATGPDGDRDQLELAEILAEALGIAPALTLAMSTGLIGTRLPVAQLRDPIREVVDRLATTDAGLSALAEQMCTTDRRPKAASIRLVPSGDDAPGGPVTVSGIAKGVGMIHPRMATMLAILLTDAAVEPATLRETLLPVVERTWNQLTVDGDMSTNDTVFLLASGAAPGGTIEAGSPAAARLAEGVEAVARWLARQQAADGEGATTLITGQVSGARDDHEARAVARSIVGSSLVKAAVHGRDPNWGRIAAAVGSAGFAAGGAPVPVAEDRLRIAIGGVPVFEGRPVSFDRALVSDRMAAAEVVIRVDFGAGDGVGEAFGCDLSPEYVIENAAYST
jgi:glutamate N-acetyltransferase/amino-acid N-acetyltransferase